MDTSRKLLREAMAQRGRNPECWPAEKLLTADLGKLDYFVERILPEGLTMLVSPAKVGKSFFAGNVAYAISCGGYALGHLKTQETGVIYLDLEQHPIQAKERWSKIIPATRSRPLNLDIYFQWPRLDNHALDTLENILLERPFSRVIFVDIFSMIKPMGRINTSANAYDVEYEMLSKVKQFAAKKRLSIVLVHHNKKGKVDDPLESISGTAAASGVPDCLWLLSRDRGKTIGSLYVTGRVPTEAKFSLDWDPQMGGWVLCNGGRPD